jgi:protein-disulfide isomerase
MRRIVLLATLLLWAAPALADVPWSQLPNVDAAALGDDVKARAVEVMKTQRCYHECSDTVLACVEKENPSRTALRAAGFITRQAARGKPAKDIARDLMDRARSVHPFKTVDIDLDAAACAGPRTAPVVVVAFTDFECPFCRIVSPILHAIASARNGKVTYCFKFFPVKGHGPMAVETSKLGVAADALGKFWEFHQVMYQNFEKHEMGDVEGYAGKVGLDWGEMKRVAESKETRQRVAASKREGLKLGVKSTPTIYVNGKLYHGEKSEVELKDRIEEELGLVE